MRIFSYFFLGFKLIEPDWAVLSIESERSGGQELRELVEKDF